MVIRSDQGIETIFGQENLSAGATQQVVKDFRYEDYMLYGFIASVDEVSDKSLEALGIIFYDYPCVNEERIRLGNNFVWGIEPDLDENDTWPKQKIEADLEPIIEVVKAKHKDYELSNLEIYVTIGTLSMNLCAFVCLAAYCGYKCKACISRWKKEKKQKIILVNE